MTWQELHNALQFEEVNGDRLIASLMSVAWSEAAERGSPGLHWDLAHNSNSPLGVCYALDYGGVPVTDAVMQALARIQGNDPISRWQRTL